MILVTCQKYGHNYKAKLKTCLIPVENLHCNNCKPRQLLHHLPLSPLHISLLPSWSTPFSKNFTCFTFPSFWVNFTTPFSSMLKSSSSMSELPLGEISCQRTSAGNPSRPNSDWDVKLKLYFLFILQNIYIWKLHEIPSHSLILSKTV